MDLEFLKLLVFSYRAVPIFTLSLTSKASQSWKTGGRSAKALGQWATNLCNGSLMHRRGPQKTWVTDFR